jgi:REP element-mobilizing transposase RayT
MLDRVKVLSSVFAIDVCAYAIMSNHFHLVLHIDTHQAQSWSSDEVIDRWLKLTTGPIVAHRYVAGISLTTVEQEVLAGWVATWRTRLADLSWYMRCLNETIARMANKEDKCTGRFWEGRFRSQALLDDAALVACMAYVDLNPIRAKLCKTLEQSAFTSIQERLKAFTQNPKKANQTWLLPMASEKASAMRELPIRPTDYFALVDWTGRTIRSDKRGAIPATVKPILQKLGVEEDNWVKNTHYFGNRFGRVLGRIEQIRRLAVKVNQKWLTGVGQARAFYH